MNVATLTYVNRILGVSVIALAGLHSSTFAQTAARTSVLISEIGAKAGTQYHGDGLKVASSPDGASLYCVFQRLEGHVTREGLWLSSSAEGSNGARFRVVATEVGRADPCALFENWWQEADPSHLVPRGVTLPCSGVVNVVDNFVRFKRDELTEEYSVSADGVRQDFIVERRPEGEGKLRVDLEVTAATAEPMVNGVRLLLDGSNRKLAYNHLHVTDASGRKLSASVKVSAANRLAVLVNDSNAVYPIRIDPTFGDENWTSMGGIPGANNTVNALAVDGSGNLYIGGNFTVAGETVANRIAKWNGSSWSTLGSGMNSNVLALAVSGSDVYAGGDFTTAGGIVANRIAKWNGSSWSALGSGMNSNVLALAVSGSDLYAGGNFTTADGNAASRIAKWNGSSWSALGPGMNNSVYALALLGSDVYAGGDFTTAGGTGTNYIAKWNGSSWSALGSGMNSFVRALAVSDTNLFAGGWFTSAGGTTANYVAKWNGSNWSALGSGPNNYVYALAASGSDLYVGGLFLNAGGVGGVNARRIAKWNGSAWSALGLGMDQNGVNVPVSALAVSGGTLYAGGTFEIIRTNPAFVYLSVDNIAKWNSGNWSALGAGIERPVRALAVSGTNLFAGGYFFYAGNTRVNSIANWDGNVWSALGPGLSGGVQALAAIDGGLYVGGQFGYDSGTPYRSDKIVKWTGSSWAGLGTGSTDSDVFALAVSGTNLYAGGGFTVFMNQSIRHTAKWDGISWSAFSSVLWDGAVSALAVSGSDLYAGGFFTSVQTTNGSTPSKYVAKWDGSSWSPLGTGMNSSVSALVVSGNYLYAGGSFTNAGGTAASRIAKWNGSSWSALGSGLNGSVYALAVSGSDLYVGGDFTLAGDIAANRIAKWNGSSWSALGSGMDSTVYALAVSGTNLFAGGQFTTAGGKVSGFAARANIGVSPGRFGNLSYSSISGFTCTFLDATFGQPYRIQTSGSLTAGSWTDLTNFNYTEPVVIAAAPTGSTNKFFRAISP